jgi:ribosomal protein S19
LLKVSSKDAIKLWSKGTRLFSDLLGKNLQVYNGVKFVDLSVKNEMWGFFIGHFILTKRITSDIHSKTRRNKRGRRKKKK